MGPLIRAGVVAAKSPAVRAVAKKAVERATPYVQRGVSLARKELMRSETAMRKRWDHAGPAARKYIEEGLKHIRRDINKTY